MNEPRRHHIAPKFYLRGFGNERSQVQVVARDETTRSFVSNVNDAAVQRDFYSLEFDDGMDHVIETDLLGEVETAAAPALERLVSSAFPPSRDDRELISLFLAVQWVRGEGRIEQVEVTIQQLAELTAANITHDAARRAIEATEQRTPTDEEVDKLVEFLSNPEKYRIKVDRNRVLQRTFELIDGAVPWFFRRKWVLLRAGDASFLTSDAPVVLWSRPELRPFGVGLATAQEIIFPVNRKHTLVMFHESKRGEIAIDASLTMVQHVNGCVATNARRSIIHHPSDKPLEGIQLPTHPKIERPRAV